MSLNLHSSIAVPSFHEVARNAIAVLELLFNFIRLNSFSLVVKNGERCQFKRV